MNNNYASGVKPSDEMSVVFHIMQDGKPVSKEVIITRENLIKYNAKPKAKFAELYEMIVADKVYIRITDVGNSN